MVAAAVQQALAKTTISACHPGCAWGASQNTQIMCCCSSASSKRPSYLSQAVPTLGLLQSQQDHTTKLAIELVFRADE